MSVLRLICSNLRLTNGLQQIDSHLIFIGAQKYFADTLHLSTNASECVTNTPIHILNIKNKRLNKIQLIHNHSLSTLDENKFLSRSESNPCIIRNINHLPEKISQQLPKRFNGHVKSSNMPYNYSMIFQIGGFVDHLDKTIDSCYGILIDSLSLNYSLSNNYVDIFMRKNNIYGMSQPLCKL